MAMSMRRAIAEVKQRSQRLDDPKFIIDRRIDVGNQRLIARKISDQ
jgi:hypothetical protein